MLIGYTRVSTETQSLARQELGLDIDRLFSEKVSGKDRDRPALNEMLRFARDGDTVRVHSLDRLARSLLDLESIVRELTGNGVTVEFITERLTFKPNEEDPASTLMMQVLGSIAQFERSLIKQRQRDGIAKAKARGVYTGRKPALTAEQIASARERRDSGVPLSRIARDLGVARTTLHAALAGAGAYANS
ncbi:recombinase family protein [Serinicoccus marinus]|uniref:recombinase family protein n=1 Tax=Serinicoccus marinus TaxID=247333 RepID=UPI0003B57926|nr:recombinase family protein [Serinicoccus marinus]